MNYGIVVVVEMENNILKVIAEKFGLKWPMPDSVKEIDKRILVDEMMHIHLCPPKSWGLDDIEPVGVGSYEFMEPVKPEDDATEFLRQYRKLFNVS